MIAVMLIFSCTDSGEGNETYTPGENDTQVETTNEKCDPRFLDYVQPEPADPSVPVNEPLSGMKYSFGINDSGRTVTMNEGDIFEITLRYSPSLPFNWLFIVEPDGLLLLNAGEFTGISPDEESYLIRIKGPWNSRWRYLAETEGTYVFDGILAIRPCDRMGNWNEFNMTVVVE